MRRLLRTLLNTTTVLSGVLCVATAVLWVRGHFVIDRIMWMSSAGPAPAEVREWSVVSAAGAICVERSRLTISTLDAVQSAAWDARRAKFPIGVRWTHWPFPTGAPASSGFVFAHDRSDMPTAWSSNTTVRLDQCRIGLPNWLIAVVTAILPARGAILHVRRRRDSRIGLCTTCGYDLRGTPDRCPECGAVAQRSGKNTI